MSTTKKPTGIIYRAFNKISIKSYIGQSRNTLEIRKRQHYYKAREKNTTYKFVNALRLYPENSWVWEVLIEVEVDKLNDYEKFFIQDLDTLNNGYNSIIEKYRAGKKYVDNIYELYHDEYGIVSGTRDDFRLIDVDLARKLWNLKTEDCKSYKGWRLLKNKDYAPPTGIITLIHYEHGTHSLKRKEFTKRFNLCTNDISMLTKKVNKSCKGWILAENKHERNEIWGIISLTHPVEGTFTLPATEFKRRFGLSLTCISHVRNGASKSHKNWRLAEEK